MLAGHGDDRHLYGAIRADFSSNVPGGIDLYALREHLWERFSMVGRYPEPSPFTLECELADRLGLAPEQVVATNGATEAIYLAAHLAARRGGSAAVVEPTFAEYRDACQMYGLEVLDAATPLEPPAGVRSVWCCNPNNPTGRVWERSRLLKAIDAAPATLFVIDQSYEAFTERPVLSAAEAAARANVIVIHSMTKRYAVPGLRLGFLTAPAAVCAEVRRLRMPWSVNALAIEAGRFLLRGEDGFSLSELLTEAARLASALGEMRVSGAAIFAPQPTDTHFFLVETARGTAAELKEWLAREEGILIRNADNFRGLTPRHFRLAAQTADHNSLLLNALRRWTASQ